ncbi:carbohydrate ABC transporter permease [Cohnella mopanensis]|uniref:carbohydrate ABC transporter permease n=1 Tax=Cohnella mopanensis TaxID=2911966 RepID=UPI001EF8194C|nr:sugar ABC transporter permease [Cohnella mopanensis]
MISNRSKYATAALFLLPAFAVYTVLLIYPVLQSVFMSFYEWNGIAGSKMVFSGLDNYKTMFQMPEFWTSLANVLKFILIGFALQMPLSFFLGYLISRKMKGNRFFKTAFFMPVVLPMTAVALMWTFILFPNGGLFNTLLTEIGLGNLVRNWLGDTTIVTYTTPIINMWVYAGLNMIIFSAGIVGIPEQLYQAAAIDGATGWRKLRYITIPLLKDTFKIYAVTCFTGSLRVFDIIFVMTSGGPNGASDVPATLLYYQGFKYMNFGLANSIGTFILVAGLFLSIVTNRYLNNDK